MQKIAIIQISEAGVAIAARLQETLGAQIVCRDSIATNWQKFDAVLSPLISTISTVTLPWFASTRWERMLFLCSVDMWVEPMT